VPGGAVEYFDVQRLAKLPGVSVTTKGWEFFAPHAWLWINNRKAPMDNIKFRQALMFAIDREAICKVAWQGFAKPATGPFNSNIKFHSTGRREVPAQRRHREEAARRGRLQGETLRMLPLPYGETWTRTAEILRQNLLQAGVKIEMVATDVAGWNQKLNEWDYDLAFTYVYQYGDPALGVARNYTTANIAKGSPFNNVEGYSNPKVDELFDAGAKEADPEKRKALYLQVPEDPARRGAGRLAVRDQLPDAVPHQAQQHRELGHRPERQPERRVDRVMRRPGTHGSESMR
jgi:peptide/nickel transport system substrate-binding protein